jgi:pimeloyl-ACP methyl ester carboxylesterase
VPSVTGADGNQVAYEVEGDGPEVILIHGITENRHSWGVVRPRLAESSKVISVDLRGHGDSEPAPAYALDAMAADVKAVADEVGAARPAVVGHSLGGFVGSIYAASYPTYSVVNVDQPLALAGFKEQLSGVEALLRGEQFEAVIGQMFDGLMGPLPEAERSRVTGLRRPEQDVVLGIWEPVFTMSVEELDELSRSLLSGVEAPYLTILGEDLGPEYAMWLRSVIPQAEIEVWAGDAHYPHLMEPERFITRIAEFTA